MRVDAWTNQWEASSMRQPVSKLLSSRLLSRRFYFCLAVCLAAMPAAWAQVGAALSGVVVDQSQSVVSGAAVTVKNTDTGAVRGTTTDSAGRYQVVLLPVGNYEIHVSKTGFAEVIRAGVRLVVGQDATVDFSLSVGQVSQQLTVSADAPPVSLSTTDISGLVGDQQVRNLPLNGRSFDELLTLNPGVVNFTWEKTGGIGVSNSTVGNNFGVEGNRPQQNLFLLNGVEFTGAAENNMQPGGTSQQLLGVDAVQEFNVLRDSYSAEYGKRPGAQVSIVTSGGTENQLHGSVYDFLRNNAFDARNFFDGNSVPEFRAESVWGGSRRAALQKDKTFFFTNFEDAPTASASDRRGYGSRHQHASRVIALRADHVAGAGVFGIRNSLASRPAVGGQPPDQSVATRLQPGAPDFRRNFRRRSTRRCKPFAITFRGRCGSIINFRTRIT